MIPKTIHYCWFGGGKKPPIIELCIDSWKKKMPDYEIREWNENNFDVHMSAFCSEAYNARKWAFVADYCRLYILAKIGGIYMDTDVIALKSFDPLLLHSFLTCQEYYPEIYKDEILKSFDCEGERLPGVKEHIRGIGIQSGVMMSEAGNKYAEYCLDFYNNLHFDINNQGGYIVCRVLSMRMEHFGYRYKTSRQELGNGIIVETPEVFANMESLNRDSYAWHLYYRSWGERFSLKQKIRNQYSRVYLLMQLLLHKKFDIQLMKAVYFAI